MSAIGKVVVGCYLQLNEQPRQNGKTLPCARLLGELDRLKNENDKLRDEFHKMDEWHSEELLAAMDENAKLRELCADMWFWGYEGHMDSESQEWQMKHIDGVLDRLRELRVVE